MGGVPGTSFATTSSVRREPLPWLARVGCLSSVLNLVDEALRAMLTHECGDQRRQSRGVTQRQHMVGSLKLGKGGYETSDTLGSGGGKLEGD
jgi:hypothetical protein